MKANYLLGIVGIRSLHLTFVSAQLPMITDQVEAVNFDESNLFLINFKM